MKIQTKKSQADSLQVSEMYSDHLHKSYDFESGDEGIVIITSLIIRNFRDKKIKDKKEIHQAWELVQLLKKCTIDFERTFNFNFYIEDGQIQIIVGNDCAYIKNHMSEYEDYLRRLETEGIESYIQFELEAGND